jgi:hypothetical protein
MRSFHHLVGYLSQFSLSWANKPLANAAERRQHTSTINLGDRHCVRILHHIQAPCCIYCVSEREITIANENKGMDMRGTSEGGNAEIINSVG